MQILFICDIKCFLPCLIFDIEVNKSLFWRLFNVMEISKSKERKTEAWIYAPYYYVQIMFSKRFAAFCEL